MSSVGCSEVGANGKSEGSAGVGSQPEHVEVKSAKHAERQELNLVAM